MITAGIDLASQAAHTAGCSIAFSDGRAKLESLVVGVDDGAILEMGKVDKVGIDVPLGWPVAFIVGVRNASALDGTGVVVEVYPAAALRRWALLSRGYKRKDGSAGAT